MNKLQVLCSGLGPFVSDHKPLVARVATGRVFPRVPSNIYQMVGAVLSSVVDGKLSDPHQQDAVLIESILSYPFNKKIKDTTLITLLECVVLLPEPESIQDFFNFVLELVYNVAERPVLVQRLAAVSESEVRHLYSMVALFKSRGAMADDIAKKVAAALEHKGWTAKEAFDTITRSIEDREKEKGVSLTGEQALELWQLWVAKGKFAKHAEPAPPNAAVDPSDDDEVAKLVNLEYRDKTIILGREVYINDSDLLEPGTKLVTNYISDISNLKVDDYYYCPANTDVLERRKIASRGMPAGSLLIPSKKFKTRRNFCDEMGIAKHATGVGAVTETLSRVMQPSATQFDKKVVFIITGQQKSNGQSKRKKSEGGGEDGSSSGDGGSGGKPAKKDNGGSPGAGGGRNKANATNKDNGGSPGAGGGRNKTTVRRADESLNKRKKTNGGSPVPDGKRTKANSGQRKIQSDSESDSDCIKLVNPFSNGDEETSDEEEPIEEKKKKKKTGK